MASLFGLPAWLLLQVRLFFTALQFYTRLPIPAWVGYDAEWVAASTRYFPSIGLLVGAASAAVYFVTAMVLPGALAILLSTAAGIYLTGALHEDGFADVCDGFGGGYTPDRILTIMNDSRIGAFGAIGIGLMLSIKCMALASLPAMWLPMALIAGHALSRVAPTALVWRLTYVKPQGKAKLASCPMSGMVFVAAAIPPLAVLTYAAVQELLPRAGVLAALIAVVGATLWLAKMFYRRLGGYTGDCLGAVQQVSEVTFYLVLVARGS